MDKNTAIEHFESLALNLEPRETSLRVMPQHTLLRKEDIAASGAFAHLPIFVKSLGGDRAFVFSTFEITPNAIFVICSDLKKYPFKPGATLLESVVKLQIPSTKEQFYLSFMTKIDRVVENDLEEEGPTGFVLRIVQASFDDRKTLDQFIEEVRKIQSQAN